MTTVQSLHWHYFLVDITLNQWCTIVLSEAFYARQLCGAAITGGGSMEMSDLMQLAAMGARKMALIEWFLGAPTLLVVLRRIAYVLLGTCLNRKIMFMVSGAVGDFVDLIILVLSIHRVFKLHLPVRTRVTVTGVFTLGGFVVITNVLRIHALYWSSGSPNGMLLAHVCYSADFATF